MAYNRTPNETKQTLKTGLLYLLIAFPFVAVVAIWLTIANVSLPIIMLCNVVTGGIVVFISYLIHNKIKEKRKEKEKLNPKKFDPFKD